MTSDPIDWTEDVQTNPEQEYRALLKSLRRTRNFGLFFVQCSPVEGERLIQRIRSDLPQKQTEVFTLTATVTNLYDEVAALSNKDQIEILFIQGLEHPLYDYEQERLWNEPEQRYSYDESGVPKLLAHLNLSRERFRDHFQMCFVFLVPLFALKYLMRRAPDFFDWRSGVLEFAMDAERVEQESQQLALEGDYDQYLTWTPQQRNVRILELQALLEEPQQTPERKSDLLFKQGNLFVACHHYKAAIASYDQAISIKPNIHEAWFNRGAMLFALERYEEAIASYDQAIAIKPDDHAVWGNRGLALNDLGRSEEAVASYDRAISINPDLPEVWTNRGNALFALGRLEEAISSYEKTIEINPDYHETWYARGSALSKLGQSEAAIASYDQAIALNLNDYQSWNNRGNVLSLLGQNEAAIVSYKKAIEINPEYYQACFGCGLAQHILGQNESAIVSYKKAIAINPDYYEAWDTCGLALSRLERNEEATASYDQAIAINPDLHAAWYNRAYCYAHLGKLKESLENLQRAIELNPEYREMAKMDADFDGIRQDARFQALVGE